MGGPPSICLLPTYLTLDKWTTGCPALGSAPLIPPCTFLRVHLFPGQLDPSAPGLECPVGFGINAINLNSKCCHIVQA